MKYKKERKIYLYIYIYIYTHHVWIVLYFETLENLWAKYIFTIQWFMLYQ